MLDESRAWLVERETKKGAVFDLRWRDPATNQWRSKAVGKDRKMAERKHATLIAELDSGAYQDIRKVRWADFQSEHVENMPPSVNRDDTDRTLRMFGEVCKPAGPHAITFSMIETFARHLRAKGNAVATTNKRLRYLRASLNKAIDRGYIVRNPFERWRWAREEQKVIRVLSDEEKTKLLDACPGEQWRTFVYVALTTGCRRGELLSLEWSRVDFDNMTILVTGTKAKRDRLQPLNNPATAMLRELQAMTLADGGPFVSMMHNTHKAFRKIVEAAGIDRCTVHDLRRTFCTDLARLGCNQLVVQRLAGHANASTTARYYQRIDMDSKREAVAKLA